jgi:hypothetical protein
MADDLIQHGVKKAATGTLLSRRPMLPLFWFRHFSAADQSSLLIGIICPESAEQVSLPGPLPFGPDCL